MRRPVLALALYIREFGWGVVQVMKTAFAAEFRDCRCLVRRVDGADHSTNCAVEGAC
jgi:hypothetical protein